MDTQGLEDYQKGLVERFEAGDTALTSQYKAAARKVGELFDNWFGTGKSS